MRIAKPVPKIGLSNYNRVINELHKYLTIRVGNKTDKIWGVVANATRICTKKNKSARG